MRSIQDFLHNDRAFFEAFEAAKADGDLSAIKRWKDELEGMIKSPDTPWATKDLARSRYNDLSDSWRGC